MNDHDRDSRRRREWSRRDERPGDEPRSFGMNMPGNFGFDRGGEAGAYFGRSDRGRGTSSGYALGHGFTTGRDLDRGFAGTSFDGGTDRGYSGGLNYGWGGGAYQSGMAHDRFDDVPPRLRSREQTMRGRGPRNYQRSDERLRELVCEQLTEHHDIDASEVEVKVENGVVRLDGEVADRRMKRLAEDEVASVFGVQDVENRLRVTRR